ncbi:MAG: penicillin-binding protein 1A [Pseudomonadota bacterium]
MKALLVIFRSLVGMALLGVLLVGGGAMYVYVVYAGNVPDTDELADYAPPMVTRVHANDGRMMAEYAIENRVFVPIEEVPTRVIDAFLSAEDKSFYSHPGVDVRGIVRALIANIERISSGQRPEGASTITQQVAKNFFLTNEVSIGRKIEEAILAFRIESALSKDEILELYLNEIYLGQGNYGVVTAAQNYFNKNLNELTVEEAAYLAALPKAPNRYHPVDHKPAAMGRRNWVLSRMAEDGRITRAEADAARARDLVTRPREETQKVAADYFTEDVRRQIKDLYGDSGLYEGGLVVHSTLDPRLQAIADEVLRRGLIRYDRRHGWRGPVARFATSEATFEAMDAKRKDAREKQVQDLLRGRPEGWRSLPPNPVLAPKDQWQATLASVEAELPPLPPVDLVADWKLAVVLDESNGSREAVIGLADGTTGVIPRPEVAWARAWRPNQRVGGKPSRASEVLDEGDIIYVEHVTQSPSGAVYRDPNNYGLRQVPNVEGALVAMDPHSGRVLAMTGGWSFKESEFNRASQAQRQPGSSFKPFVYLAALENGFTPASILHDAPIEISQGPGLPKWRPKNYSGRYYGPTPLRVGIEKSRNLMTVRLAQKVGMDVVADYTNRFGVVDNLQQVLSTALGSAETTLLRMVAGYAMIVNGGHKVTPTMIDRVQDRYGEVIYRHDARTCSDCLAEDWQGQPPPVLADTREQIADPISAYQMTSIMQGVIQRGTGAGRASIGRPAGGKTGTTNDNFDVWFIGFTPDLVAGVFVGFDRPRTLGRSDTGSTVAAPIFKDFMKAATEGTPEKSFQAPPDTVFINVSLSSGQRATGAGTIQEAFKPGTGPDAFVSHGVTTYTPSAKDVTTLGVPGLY